MSSPELSARHYVWDRFVRTFHWATVLCFTGAYPTTNEWMAGHRWADYTLTALILARLMWGVMGSQHARFRDFLRGPQQVKQYLTGLWQGRSQRYRGHNPVGGWMIVALLSSLLLTTITGMLMIAPGGKGPLAHTVLASLGGHWLEEPHEFFANTTVGLIVIHLAGVVISSLLHRENLIRAMVTGYKSGDSAASANASSLAGTLSNDKAKESLP